MQFLLGLVEFRHVLQSCQNVFSQFAVKEGITGRLFGYHFVTLLSKAKCCHPRWEDPVDGHCQARMGIVIQSVLTLVE